MQSSSNPTQLPKVESSGAGLPMPFARVKSNINQSDTAPVTIGSVALQPPPSMTMVPKSCEGTMEINGSVAIADSNELGDAQESVMNMLNEINQSLASTDATKVEEIGKRLNTLETLWVEGRIDDKLKTLLANTAKGMFVCMRLNYSDMMDLIDFTALQDNQFSKAIDLQRSIIVDHGSAVCAQWGPALRQLILLKESTVAPAPQSIPDICNVDEPKFINPLDDQSSGSSSKTVGRVKHL